MHLFSKGQNILEHTEEDAHGAAVTLTGCVIWRGPQGGRPGEPAPLPGSVSWGLPGPARL